MGENAQPRQNFVHIQLCIILAYTLRDGGKSNGVRCRNVTSHLALRQFAAGQVNPLMQEVAGVVLTSCDGDRNHPQEASATNTDVVQRTDHAEYL